MLQSLHGDSPEAPLLPGNHDTRISTSCRRIRPPKKNETLQKCEVYAFRRDWRYNVQVGHIIQVRQYQNSQQLDYSVIPFPNDALLSMHHCGS